MNQHDFGEHAEDNLRFIRSTMERSTRFTAVSGWGGVGMGLVGLSAAVVGGTFAAGSQAWLLTWLVAAAVAAPIGLASIWRKAARTGVAFTGASARSFALCFFPVLVAGAVITWSVALVEPTILPTVWLSLYGAAITAGAAFSVRVLPAMGGGFLLLGAIAALAPAFGNMAMLIGFGVLHIGFGAYVAAQYDG